MSFELVCYATCVAAASTGVYLNLCYLRSTHRSTVYPKFCLKQLRFMSVMQIVLACSNIIAAVSMWGARVNRTKKSEAFFAVTLSVTRAVPQLTILWTTLERVMFKMSAGLRENPKFRSTAMYRIFQIIFSMIAEIVLRTTFMNTDEQKQISTNYSLIELNNADELFVKNSLISNFYFDYYHGIIFVPCLVVACMMFNSARASHSRAGLIGGMRNDAKIQNLSGQMKFFRRSYIPLYFACLSDYVLQLVIKRGMDLEDAIIDLLYLNSRCYLPIVYPMALIALNKNLRADYFANFILCRKARNLHKESKVKVIATKESQESIIANLKMIGILSDVDTSQGGPSAAGLAMMGMGPGIGRPSSSIGGSQRIAKDPSSITSVGSMAKTSVSSMGGGGASSMMMFHTRPKGSVPSMGSVG